MVFQWRKWWIRHTKNKYRNWKTDIQTQNAVKTGRQKKNALKIERKKCELLNLYWKFNIKKRKLVQKFFIVQLDVMNNQKDGGGGLELVVSWHAAGPALSLLPPLPRFESPSILQFANNRSLRLEKKYYVVYILYLLYNELPWVYTSTYWSNL